MSNGVKATLLVLGPLALIALVTVLGGFWALVIVGVAVLFSVLVGSLIATVKRALDEEDRRKAQVPPPPCLEPWPTTGEVTYNLSALLDSDRFVHKYETTTEVIDDGKPVARDGT